MQGKKIRINRTQISISRDDATLPENDATSEIRQAIGVFCELLAFQFVVLHLNG